MQLHFLPLLLAATAAAMPTAGEKDTSVNRLQPRCWFGLCGHHWGGWHNPKKWCGDYHKWPGFEAELKVDLPWGGVYADVGTNWFVGHHAGCGKVYVPRGHDCGCSCVEYCY